MGQRLHVTRSALPRDAQPALERDGGARGDRCGGARPTPPCRREIPQVRTGGGTKTEGCAFWGTDVGTQVLPAAPKA